MQTPHPAPSRSARFRHLLPQGEKEGRKLFVHERHRVRDARPRRPVAVGLMLAVGIPERDPADHPSVVAEPKMPAHQFGVKRQRSLRDRRHAQRLRSQHETRDIAAAIDRTIDAERLVGMDDGDMRRAEEIEIFQRLFSVAGFIATRNSERIVELKAAFAAALEIDAAIFARERKIPAVRLAARGGAIHHIAEFFCRVTRGDRNPPRLAVTPRRSLLCGHQDPFDGRARHRVWLKRAAGKKLVQQLLEHVDALVNTGHLFENVRHVYLPLVGILLNGTSLSTRMSLGRPSTRSAMMLRRISSVPPAIRIDGEDNSICWNCPRASSSAAPVKTPAAPSRSIAYIAIS